MIVNEISLAKLWKALDMHTVGVQLRLQRKYTLHTARKAIDLMHALTAQADYILLLPVLFPYELFRLDVQFCQVRLKGQTVESPAR